VAERSEHLDERAAQGKSVHEGRDRHHGARAPAQRVADLRHRENWAERHERVRGRQEDEVRVADRRDDAGRRPRALGAVVGHPENGIGVAPAYEPVLEGQVTFGRRDDRAKGVVRCRHEPHGDAERSRDPDRGLRERHPRAQEPRTDEVQADVAVPEREPALASQGPGARKRVVRLVADPPAALLVEQAGERVEHRVEIRGHVEAEDLHVVADVPHGRDRPGAGRAGERVHEPRPAEPSAEHRDPHCAGDATRHGHAGALTSRGIRSPPPPLVDARHDGAPARHPTLSLSPKSARVCHGIAPSSYQAPGARHSPPDGAQRPRVRRRR
jgi:hypothetical protein